MSQVQTEPVPAPAPIEGTAVELDLSRIEKQAATEFAELMMKRRIEKPPIPLVDGKMVPTEFDQLYRIAEWLFKAGIYPKSFDTPNSPVTIAKLMVCLAAGLALGLDAMQSIRWVMVVNNVPSVWGDAIPGVLYAKRTVEYIKEWHENLNPDGTAGDNTIAFCEIKRRDTGEVKLRQFTAAEAKAASLWNKTGPWQGGYKKRMLQMRARALCARDTAPDVLAGIGIAEEEQDLKATQDAAALEKTRETVKTLVIPGPKGPEQATVSSSEPQPGRDSGGPSDGQTEPVEPDPDPDATRAAEGCSPGLPGCATEAADFSVGGDGKKHCANHPETPAPAPAEGSMFGTEPPAKPKRTKGPTPEQQQQMRKDRP